MRHQLTTLVLGDVSKALRGEAFLTQSLKKAPHYFQASVPHQLILGEEKAVIDGKEIVFQLRGYPPDIFLVKAKIEVENVFTEKMLDLEDEIYAKSYEILKKKGGGDEFSEVYSVFRVSDYKGDPEEFLKHNNKIIGSLLKSERLELDPKEIEYTINAQIKYAKNDLAIIDWDGAFLFDPEGDFDATVELITIANLQLLRHRVLDRQLDERLERTAKLVKKPEKKFFLFNNKELAENLREVIKNRMTSLSEFQALERDIKLIGDWYSARFYDLMSKKFKLEEWRKTIKDKLESLEDIYTIVIENFTVSGKERAEWIQIVGFFILQIGWLALIVLEFFYFTR